MFLNSRHLSALALLLCRKYRHLHSTNLATTLWCQVQLQGLGSSQQLEVCDSRLFITRRGNNKCFLINISRSAKLYNLSLLVFGFGTQKFVSSNMRIFCWIRSHLLSVISFLQLHSTKTFIREAMQCISGFKMYI